MRGSDGKSQRCTQYKKSSSLMCVRACEHADRNERGHEPVSPKLPERYAQDATGTRQAKLWSPGCSSTVVVWQHHVTCSETRSKRRTAPLRRA
eukprot:2902969-Amphidinium_carterae.1